MKAFAIFGASVLALIVLIGLPWLIMGNDFFLAQYFWPRQENLRREVFEKSNAYNRGMIQELEGLYLEHAKADEKHKAAIASVVSHRYADYSDDNLPQHLRTFVRDLRNAK